MRRHEDMTLVDLVERLRHAGSVWFRNDDLLLLEELIKRMQLAVERERRESR